MFVNSSKIINIVEKFAPKCDAENWDNVGFQIGNVNSEVDKVLITLDIDDNVIEEAIEKNIDLIIAHHPLIFKPLNNLDQDTYKGKLIAKLIKNDICVYIAHTNLDASSIGLSDYLAEILELSKIEVLSNFIDDPSKGIGRIGYLSSSQNISEFIEFVKSKLNLTNVKFVGELKGKIFKVGLCTGSAMEYYQKAKEKACDIYITGDVKFHEAQDALHTNIKILDVGHFESENIYSKRLKEILDKEFERKGYDVKVVASSVNTNPFLYL
ncbi:Nif3-like dinuclear metal center hexameric protein [Helicovermis profundi]|uniref:GTP cyclohydrolase 1 type 2 homolog n=1 Tax=Helicovermis profundi TaxID=3065157 RepID=A0AAU9EX31_9FIRM|nr:Nif3-like dinuclear metal center hexameric protein [Clostridia bacterium S502]